MKYSEFFKFIEKKDHIINRLDSLTDSQKQEAIDFFTKHPNYENEIDWNRKDLVWEDIEEVIYKERISGTQLKNFVKKDKHFLVLYSDENCVLFQPLTWLGSRYLASTDVKPKVEGRWCISYQKDRRYWDDYSFDRKISFIILCTLTTKYAIEISPGGKFAPWNTEDKKLTPLDFYDEVSREVPSIERLLRKYFNVAIRNHSLVEDLHEKDLEECAYIEKVKEEEREYRIRIFPKSFKRQVRRKKYYQWDGDITYRDLKDFGLVDKECNVDERFKYFKISGKIDFKGSPITSIPIPNSVTSIGRNAFADCYYLSEITIPDGVISIGDWAFYKCKSLKEVVIPNSVTSIGKNAFNCCSSLKSVTIPDSITKIGEWAFSECPSLTEFTIPDSITKIERGTFNYCKALKDINIPNSVTSIGGFAFFACKSFKKIIIPNSVTSIEEDAFSCCTSLKSVTIGNSIKSIGEKAFSGCEFLQNIYIDKEKDSLDLNKAKIPTYCKIYWRGDV